jgi:dihydrofolate reductase
LPSQLKACRNSLLGVRRQLDTKYQVRDHTLKRFKKLTTNNVVVMGRKTHESIGKALPNRLNVILSKDSKWYKPLGDGCVVCYSIEEVLERFKFRDIFIIGGGQIYKEFLPHADKIEMTLIDKEFKGDTYFPEIGSEWIEFSRETNTNSFVFANTNDEFDYHFIKMIKQK